MQDNEKLNFLKINIDKRIDGINSRRLYYRKKTFFMYLSTAFLSTFSAIILGLNFSSWSETIRICALILSAIISLINIYNAFFNYKDLWIANNNALNKFYELKFNIEYFEKGADTISETTLDSFKDIYQQILNELNQTWLKSRTATQIEGHQK